MSSNRSVVLPLIFSLFLFLVHSSLSLTLFFSLFSSLFDPLSSLISLCRCRDFAPTLKHQLRHTRERAAGVDQNKGMVFDTKPLIDRKFADPVVQADTKL